MMVLDLLAGRPSQQARPFRNILKQRPKTHWRRYAVYGAGRRCWCTCTGQTAHLDVPDKLDARAVMRGLNAWLKTDQICVLSARAVDDDFHARFDATERRYLYRIISAPVAPAPERHRVWYQKPLDVAAMKSAAPYPWKARLHEFSGQPSGESPCARLIGLR